MFKALICVMYVDPDDKEGYKKSLETLAKLRKQYPLNMKMSPDGTFDVQKRDIIFVLTTSPNLMFFQFNTDVSREPQVLLMPYGESFNCF